MLNIYKAYQQAGNKNNFCYDNFINSRTIKHIQVTHPFRITSSVFLLSLYILSACIQEVWRQLGDYCNQLGIERKSCGDNTEVNCQFDSR